MGAIYRIINDNFFSCIALKPMEDLVLVKYFSINIFYHLYLSVQFSHNCVWLFVTPRTVAYQASLSITNSWSSLRLLSIELVMPSNHLILCCPLFPLPSVFPSIRVFSNESVFASGGQIIGTSASASVLPMNIQGWFSLGLTDLILLQGILKKTLNHSQC